MKVTRKELDEIRGRVADGTADDHDRRLHDLYGSDDDDAPGVTVRDGEQAVAAITGRADAEVVKGDDRTAQAAPKKRTRGPAR